MICVDLNCDLGELPGDEGLSNELSLLPFVTSVNIACGLHAGNPSRIRKIAREAIRLGISVGAHPGYPDLANFGRRPMEMNAEQIRDWVLFQIAAVGGIVAAERGRVTHVKPHGALYNRASSDAVTARAIATAVFEWDCNCALVGLAGGCLVAVAENVGLVSLSEVFADRNYMSDGSLVPRTQPDAVLCNAAEISSRAVDMIRRGAIRAIDGSIIAVKADTICLHGDTPNALEIAKSLRSQLEANQIRVTAARID